MVYTRCPEIGAHVHIATCFVTLLEQPTKNKHSVRITRKGATMPLADETRHDEQTADSGEEFARLVFHGVGGQTLTKDILRHTTLIGAARGSNIQLVDPDISRSHCVITLDAGKLRVRDLRSRVGITVNDVSVAVCSLHHGDRLRIGSFHATVESNLVPKSTASEQSLTARQQQLESKFSTLETEQIELQEEQKQLERRRQQLETQTIAAEENQTQVENLRKELTEQLSAAEQERQALQIKLTEIDHERELQQNQRQEFHAELDEFRSEQHRFGEQVASFEADSLAFEDSKERHVTAAAQSQTTQSNLAAERSELQEQQLQLQQVCDSLQTQLEQANQESKKSQSQLAAITAKYEATEKRFGQLSQTEEALRFELTEERQAAEQWREQCASQAETVTTLNSEISELQTHLAESHATKQALILQPSPPMEADSASFDDASIEFHERMAAFEAARGRYEKKTAAIDRSTDELEQKSEALDQQSAVLEAHQERLARDRKHFQEEQDAFEALQERFREDAMLLESYRKPPTASHGKQSPFLVRVAVDLFKGTAIIGIAIALGYIIGRFVQP